MTELAATAGGGRQGRVLAPEQFADAQAREVARMICEDGRIAFECAADLLVAVEAYDLALARLEWAQAACCETGATQVAAIAWHRLQRRTTHVALLSCLREAVAVEPTPAR